MNQLRRERLNTAEVFFGDWNVTETSPSAHLPWDFNMTKLKRFEVKFKIKTKEGIKPCVEVVKAANQHVAVSLAKAIYNRN